MRGMEKWRRGVGGVVALVFILAALIMLFSLIYYSISISSKLEEIRSFRGELEAEKASIPKSIEATWKYESTTSKIYVNVTNSWTKPVVVTGVLITFSDSTFRTLTSQLGLPKWVSPGETITLAIDESRMPTSIVLSVGSNYAISSVPAEEYVPPQVQPVPQPNYTLTLAPEAMGPGTVSEIGYDTVAYTHSPTNVFTIWGIPSASSTLSNLTSIDGEAYTVEGEVVERSGWLEGWNYRRPVVIDNNSPQTLTGYQVMIELNSSNFDFSKARSDGRDLRIALGDGTLLPYWIREWDPTNNRAKIWTKVPYIPGGQSITVYLYYGNPDAQSAENPEEVFEFFDHFEGNTLNTTKWTTNDTDFDLTDLEVRDSTLIIPGGDSIEAVRTIQTFSPPFAVHYYLKPERENTREDWDSGVAIGGSREFLLCFVDDQENSPFGPNPLTILEIRYGIWWIRSVGVGVPRDGVDFHEYRVVILEDDNNFADLTDGRFNDDPYDRTSTGYIWLVIDSERRNRGSVYDWIFVRKYVDPEPTVIVGSEEGRYAYYSQVEVEFSGVEVDSLFLDITFRVKFNVTPILLYFTCWNGSSWNEVYSVEVTSLNYENYTFRIVGREYYDGGVLRVRVSAESNYPFIEEIDYAETVTHVTSRTLIYVGVGGSSEILVYDPQLRSFINAITAPGQFLGSSDIAYDSVNNLLWFVEGVTIYYYNISSGTWSTYTNLPKGVREGCNVEYSNGKLFVFIGGGFGDVYVYDVRSWSTSYTRISLPWPLYNYSSVEGDERYLYVVEGGGGVGFLKIDSQNLAYTLLEDAPTGYSVGLAYDPDRGRVWLLGKGGGLFYYDISNDKWYPYNNQPPYTPESPGDRLEYYGNSLIHFRDDSTREVWIIEVS